MEDKGTPAAGTPSTAAGAPAGGASTTGAAGATGSGDSQNGGKIFQGCLSGNTNDYRFSANGKAYRLQGNTSMLHGLEGHQVEVTGEEFNGKAIQVNGARDLGASCSSK